MADIQNQTDDVADTNVADTDVNGRRLLMKGGIAAAAAAVVGLGSVHRAQAANGDTMVVGMANLGTSTTSLIGGSSFFVANGSSGGNASVYGTQNNASRFGVRGDNSADDGVGVYGQASGSSGGQGVRGVSDGASGIGVYGAAHASAGVGVYGAAAGTDGIGVYGLHDASTASGGGVLGKSTQGPGVIGNGTTADLMADGSGRILLSKAGQAGAPGSPGGSAVLARDASATLWWSHGANQWRQISGPTTAGAFHAIDPVRAYDSRIAAYSVNGPLNANQNRVISVADGHDGAGAVTAANAVPAGATAIAYNVTVTGTTGPNYLAVVPGNAAAFTASTINWSGANASLANGSIVKLDGARNVKVFCGDQSGSTHVIIDVTGYFL